MVLNDLGCREAFIKNLPAVNVLKNEEFKERASLIFSITNEILRRSFGPYGAPTLISDYPYMVATKDGFTIARYITYDHFAGSPIDRVIFQMMMDICARVNYAVGDGTTTAIMVTDNLYQSVINIDRLNELSSRELLMVFRVVRDKILDKFKEEIVSITPDNMIEMISDIANVSSNGDAEITDMIRTAYEKLGCPALRCEASEGSTEYLEISDGYTSKVRLGDDIYINTNQKIGEYHRLNVLIFDHRVNTRTYRDIIAPLTAFCKLLREQANLLVKLVCIAPSYDETVLQLNIKQDILNEFKRSKSVDLIVMTYPKMNDLDKQSIADLAMLLNTEIIDKSMELRIFDQLDTEGQIPAGALRILNIIDMGLNSRGITNKLPKVYDDIIDKLTSPNAPEGYVPEYLFRAGYADSMKAGMDGTVFNVSCYNEDLYNKFLENAKRHLDDTIAKFQEIGSYSNAVYEAQYRYASLRMKSATIYVGGNSKLSKEMRLSAVEDAVRAAESAFKHGCVQGCNVSMLRAIEHVERDETIEASEADIVLDAFRTAYIDVYKQMLLNGGNSSTEGIVAERNMEKMMESNSVLDLRTGEYTNHIINSSKTDTEILVAVVDLLGILLSGNQVLLARYEHPVQK